MSFVTRFIRRYALVSAPLSLARNRLFKLPSSSSSSSSTLVAASSHRSTSNNTQPIPSVSVRPQAPAQFLSRPFLPLAVGVPFAPFQSSSRSFSSGDHLRQAVQKNVSTVEYTQVSYAAHLVCPAVLIISSRSARAGRHSQAAAIKDFPRSYDTLHLVMLLLRAMVCTGSESCAVGTCCASTASSK